MKTRKHADEMSTWEFMDEQFYQRALKGAYQKEFEQVKRRLDCLAPFPTAWEFMRTLWTNRPLQKRVLEDLKELWKTDYSFRPASGLVLLMALWRNAVFAGDDYWSDFFIELVEGKPPDQLEPWESCSKEDETEGRDEI